MAADTLEDNLADNHQQRYERYRQRNVQLSIACVDSLLERYPVETTKIRAVVANTTVGGMIPNLTSIIANRLNLGSSTKVIELGYMGCATALLALELIESQLQPGEVGLILSSELTSAMVNLVAESDASLVANTVFGDGIGAFLVAKRPHREKPFLRIRGYSGSVLADDQALSAITYEPNGVYHEIRLRETIPEVAGRGVRIAVEPLVRRHLVSPLQKLTYLINRKVPYWQRNISYAVLHTAGSKVLEGLTQALALEQNQVEHNFSAFRKYGNTSSASIYYSLDELTKLRQLKTGEKLLFLGYGSGFLTRGCLMEVA